MNVLFLLLLLNADEIAVSADSTDTTKNVVPSRSMVLYSQMMLSTFKLPLNAIRVTDLSSLKLTPIQPNSYLRQQWNKTIVSENMLTNKSDAINVSPDAFIPIPLDQIKDDYIALTNQILHRGDDYFYSLESAGPVSINLFNLQGNLVNSTKQDSQAGSNYFRLPDSLQPGMYMIQITDAYGKMGKAKLTIIE